MNPAPVAFTIPGDPVRDLSPNLRLHYHARARREREWRARAWLCWAAQTGRASFPGPVHLSLILCRGRACDWDHAVSSCTALMNGLRRDPRRPDREVLFVDDSARFLIAPQVVVEVAPAYRRAPEVRVRVEAAVGEAWRRTPCCPTGCRTVRGRV